MGKKRSTWSNNNTQLNYINYELKNNSMIENFAIVTLKTYNEKVNKKNLMLKML
jgi:hypothetical protein